jgi:chorismate dehydratase
MASENIDASKPRLGAVSYLNTAPLIFGLAERLPGATLTFDHPSRLADDLGAGRLDVALVPIIETARHHWQVASNACIATWGPVLSVKLLFRRPPAVVRTLAVDEGSRTSAVLAQILLAEEFAVRPEIVSLPLGATPGDVEADAILMIGDRAIRHVSRSYVDVWDLGEAWRVHTNLPFVFAAWATARDFDSAAIEPALEAARDDGVRNVETIARERAAAMDLPYDLVLAYLRDHLRFTLGERENRAALLYFEKAVALGLLDDAYKLS